MCIYIVCHIILIKNMYFQCSRWEYMKRTKTQFNLIIIIFILRHYILAYAIHVNLRCAIADPCIEHTPSFSPLLITTQCIILVECSFLSYDMTAAVNPATFFTLSWEYYRQNTPSNCLSSLTLTPHSYFLSCAATSSRYFTLLYNVFRTHTCLRLRIFMQQSKI